MYPTLQSPIRQLLEKHPTRIVFVDIGSRNGVLELKDLCKCVDAYGFEPAPAEYEKLISGKTDAFVRAGRAAPPYRSLRYFPYAISDIEGRRRFYLTPLVGSSSLFEPDLERLREIKNIGGYSYKANLGDDAFAGYSKIEVDVRTLRSVAIENAIPHIDYLKLDVQAAEYDIFRGAGDLLSTIGVIKTEVWFVPFYKGQKMFSDVDLLLREAGFDLLHFEIIRDNVGYKERRSPVEQLPRDKRFGDPFGQPLWTDAIYVNRSLSDPQRCFAQAMILLDKGYIDEALHILRTKTDVRDETLFRFLRDFHEEGSRSDRMRKRGYAAVDRLLSLYGRARSLLR